MHYGAVYTPVVPLLVSYFIRLRLLSFEKRLPKGYQAVSTLMFGMLAVSNVKGCRLLLHCINVHRDNEQLTFDNDMSQWLLKEIDWELKAALNTFSTVNKNCRQSD